MICFQWFLYLEVNFIWAIHQAHHSGEDFTLFAGIRQAFFQPLTAWYTYVWMGLIGIPPQIFLAHLQLTELYMLYIHTETIKSLGFLEYVFNCPSHHRVHHGWFAIGLTGKNLILCLNLQPEIANTSIKIMVVFLFFGIDSLERSNKKILKIHQSMVS